METERLKYFVTIAETGSLTKAAEIVGLSHSGLSKVIAALETETKLKLFRPLGRGLEITPEGKWFYQKARQILEIADEIKRGARSESSVVRIGLSSAVAMTCASALAEELSEPASLEELDIGEIEAKIISGEIDFGIAFTVQPIPELEYLEIGEVKFGAFARKDLAARGEDAPYAVPSSDYPFNPLGYKSRDGWPIDLQRSPRFSVNSFAIALDLLRGGQAAVYMPEFVAASEGMVPVKEHRAAAGKRKIYLVKRQASEETPAMKKAAKVVRRLTR